MDLSRVLEIEDFEKWLNKFSNKEIVGEVRTLTRCPISRYLESKGFVLPMVCSENIGCFTKEGKEHLLSKSYMPLWLNLFIFLLDKLPKKEVQVQVAKDLLQRVKYFLH